jgi:hypothetical protein
MGVITIFYNSKNRVVLKADKKTVIKRIIITSSKKFCEIQSIVFKIVRDFYVKYLVNSVVIKYNSSPKYLTKHMPYSTEN